jgi:hypothetical protein
MRTSYGWENARLGPRLGAGFFTMAQVVASVDVCVAGDVFESSGAMFTI